MIRKEEVGNAMDVSADEEVGAQAVATRRPRMAVTLSVGGGRAAFMTIDTMKIIAVRYEWCDVSRVTEPGAPHSTFRLSVNSVVQWTSDMFYVIDAIDEPKTPNRHVVGRLRRLVLYDNLENVIGAASIRKSPRAPGAPRKMCLTNIYIPLTQQRFSDLRPVDDVEIDNQYAIFGNNPFNPCQKPRNGQPADKEFVLVLAGQDTIHKMPANLWYKSVYLAGSFPPECLFPHENELLYTMVSFKKVPERHTLRFQSCIPYTLLQDCPLATRVVRFPTAPLLASPPVPKRPMFSPPPPPVVVETNNDDDLLLLDFESLRPEDKEKNTISDCLEQIMACGKKKSNGELATVKLKCHNILEKISKKIEQKKGDDKTVSGQVCTMLLKCANNDMVKAKSLILKILVILREKFEEHPEPTPVDVLLADE